MTGGRQPQQHGLFGVDVDGRIDLSASARVLPARPPRRPHPAERVTGLVDDLAGQGNSAGVRCAGNWHYQRDKHEGEVSNFHREIMPLAATTRVIRMMP